MAAISAKRRGNDLRHSGNGEIGIEVRKKGTAPRYLPLQFVAELGRIHAHQHEVALTGEMFCRCLDRLFGGGEVDEAVAPVEFRAAEYPRAFGFAPERSGADFEDSRHVRHNLE